MRPPCGRQLQVHVEYQDRLVFVRGCLHISVTPSFLQSQSDFMVICNVAKILELVIPLMEHPSETFLATIEEDLMKLIIKYGMTVSVIKLSSWNLRLDFILPTFLAAFYFGFHSFQPALFKLLARSCSA